MAMSRKRKRALPPWLTGVEVNSRGQPVQKLKDVPSNVKDNIDTHPQSASATDKSTSVTDKSTSVTGKSTGAQSTSATDKSTSVTGKSIGAIHSTDKSTSASDKSTNTRQTPETKDQGFSAEQLVELSYPKFVFKGTIVYSYNKDDCNLLCDDLITEMDSSTDCYIGFDTEWPVTYEKGKQAKTALIQICPSVDKCYLFHVSCMPGFPSMLKKLIEMKNFKKVGLNIEYDMWKLDVDYDIKAKEVIQTSIVELRTLANKKLRSAENWSLEGLTKNVLRLRISKDPSVRKCDWRQFPLPEEQQQYAASDAIVSLMLYLKLSGMGKTGK